MLRRGRQGDGASDPTHLRRTTLRVDDPTGSDDTVDGVRQVLRRPVRAGRWRP